MEKPEPSNEWDERTKQSEKRLHALMKATSDFIYRMSPDWKTMNILDGSAFLADTDEADPKWLDKYIYPDDLKLLTEVIFECIRDKKTFELEHRVVKPDGSIGWTYSRAIPILDETGEITEWFGAASDITGRKKTEEALQEKSRQLEEVNRQKEDILESISDCFYVLDKNLRFTYVNKPAEEMWSLTRADLIGRKIEDVFSGIIDISMSKFHQALREGTKQHYEVYSKVIGRWGDIGVYPMRDGISVYFRDITVRKRAEEALQENARAHAFHSAILESVRDPMWVTDPNLRIVYWNDAAAETLGWTAEEALGQHTGELFKTVVTGSTRDKTVSQVLQTGDFFGECLVYRKDGQQICIEASSRVVYGPDGAVIRLVSTVRDITERKHAEETKERLSALMDHNPSLVFLKDEEGRYVYLNKTYETRFIPSGNWYGKTDFDIWPRKSAELFWTNDAYVLNSGQTMQFMEDSKDMEGKRYCWLNYKFPFTDSKNQKFIGGIGIDATRLILTEEALRESEERHRRLFESIAEAFELMELIYENGKPVDYIFLDVNPAWEKMTGHKKEQVLGRKASEAVGFVESYWPEALDQALRTDEMVHIENYGAALDKWYSVNVWKHSQTACGVTITDITERKKTEEALKAERKRLLDVLETLPVMICLITPDYHIPFANKAFREKFGEAEGRFCYEYCCGFSKPCGFCESLTPLKTGQAHHWEFSSPDGNTIIDAYDFPFSDTDGSPLILEMDIDITERKRAEEALRESEVKYRTIFETAQEGIWVIDNNDKTILVNEKLQQMIGYSLDELVGNSPQVYMAPEFQVSANERLVEHMEGIKHVIDYKFIKKDGSSLWCILSSTPLFDKDGNFDGSIALITDITERVLAEEALRESEERFRVVQEVSPDGFTVLRPLRDAQGQIYDFTWVYENASIARMNGTDANAVIGQRLLELFPGHRGTPILQAYIQVAETGEPCIFEAEYDAETIGKPTWFRMAVVRMDGDIAILGQDITERVRAEEALRESEKKALILVKELEKADQNKNDFISVLSHELRNTLAAISAGVQILEVTQDINQAVKAKEIMKRQTSQLCKLVDDLLELTRISQNKVKLKKERILLNEIVINAMEDIRPEFEKKGVQLWAKIQPQPISLNADPVRIVQSIGNLLYNALKFSQKSGAVWISLYEEQNEAVISVRDTGAGINPEILSQLFKPFIQADNSLDRNNNGGLGLGLSIVKSLVELHGGQVTADSPGLGKGALFTIRLPITTGDKKMIHKEMIEKTQCNLKVLIIEDNKDLNEIICSLFEMLGHTAFAAYTGMAGIAKAKEVHPDIIFCDIGLPEKDGYEVAKIIRSDDDLKHIFLVALTGYAGEIDILCAKENGFDRHLAKPVGMTALQQILNEYKR